MDGLLTFGLAVATASVIAAALSKNNWALLWAVVGSALLGWYVSVKRVEHYNALAWAEFEHGTRALEPADGASSVFVGLVGWIPWLLYCLLVFAVTIGVRKLWQR